VLLNSLGNVWKKRKAMVGRICRKRKVLSLERNLSDIYLYRLSCFSREDENPTNDAIGI